MGTVHKLTGDPGGVNERFLSAVDELLQAWGLDYERPQPPKQMKARRLLEYGHEGERLALAATALDASGQDWHRRDVYSLAAVDSTQAEIGVPGTKVVRGRVRVEQNQRLNSFQVRGRSGNPGIYEDIYRADAGLYKHSAELSTLICSAMYEPILPEDADEEMAEIVARCHRSIMNINSTWDRFKQDAATFIRNGYAPFEVIWGERTDEDGNKSWFPWDIRYREASTVWEWIFDERQSQLLGAEFLIANGSQGSGNSVKATPNQGLRPATTQNRYVLTRGDTPATARLLVLNYGATGNNIEGVPPFRPAVGLRKLKELLLQIQGVAFQKHGCPVAVIGSEIVDSNVVDLGQTGGAQHEEEKQKMIDRVEDMRARLAPTVPEPIGIRLRYEVPTNQLPDVTPLLEYIDTQIALAFSNNGSLLGTRTGSYALASVLENSFLRSAPSYASRIAAGLSELMRWCVLFNHSDPDSIEAFPTYGFRFEGSQDATAWFNDLSKATGGADVRTLSEEIRRNAAANLGLSPTAFEPEDVPEDIEQVPGADVAAIGAEKAADAALNGGQVSALVDIVAKVVTGEIPRDAAVGIISRAFLITEEEADALLGETAVDPSAAVDSEPVPPPVVEESAPVGPGVTE